MVTSRSLVKYLGSVIAWIVLISTTENALALEFKPLITSRATIENLKTLPTWYVDYDTANGKMGKGVGERKAISPDGETVAEIDVDLGDLSLYAKANPKKRLVIEGATESGRGGQITFFNKATHLSFSPNGRNLVYLRMKELSESAPFLFGDIFIYYLRASDQRNSNTELLLVRDAVVNHVGYSSIAWTRDSERLAFVSGMDIYVYEVKAEHLERVLSQFSENTTFAIHDLAWKENNRELIFKVKDMITNKLVGYYELYGF